MVKIIFLLALPLATSLKAIAQTNSADITSTPKNWKGIGTNTNKRVNIFMTSATFSEIWDTFFHQTRFSSSIASNVKNLSTKTDIALENATVEEFLKFLEQRFGVVCTIRNKIIFISLEKRRSLSGIITDSLMQPLPNASISVKGKRNGAIAGEDGRYTLHDIDNTTTLVVTYTGKKTRELIVDTNQSLNIQLNDDGSLPEVIYSDGVQDITKSNATGAYVQPNMAQLQKLPAYNFIERLNGIHVYSVTKSNTILGAQASAFRGQSTFLSLHNPPVILGIFPFKENTDFINGFDISKITLIRDAVSGALNGTTAANGVTHAELQPWTSTPLQVDFNLNIGITGRPNLNYQAGLSPGAWIDMDTSLYRQGLVFDGGPTEKSLRNLLSKQEQGLISREQLDSAIRVFSTRHLRNDIRRKMYRSGINQQYHLALRYGNSKLGFYTSLGKDENKSPQIGNDVSRTTWFTNIGFKDKGFNFSVTNLISGINNRENFFQVPTAIPIGSLRDNNGNPSALAQQYSNEFLSAVIPWDLLNWQYDPLKELRLYNHRVNRSLQQTTIKLGYQLLDHFNVSLAYQRGLMLYENRNEYAASSFFNRDMFNRFTGYNSWPIPRGSILDMDEIKSRTSNARTQLNYKQQINTINISVLGGVEMQQQDINVNTRRIYGYDIGFNQGNINFTKDYPIAITGGHEKIPYIDRQTDSTDRFFNYFFTSHIKYKEEFIFSISARKDESNRFSLPNNKNGFPLWALGGAWLINNDFKARVSIGTSGNVNYSLSPYRTVQLVNSDNTNNALYVAGNAFFERLSWEKLTMFNAGIDFNFYNKQLSGSVDLYTKKARDLVQPVRSNPTSGTSVAYENSGAIRGHGLDITLQVKQIPLAHEWHFSSNLFLSYTKNKIASATNLVYTAEQFTDPLNNLPRAGDPPGAIYAYAYAGVNVHGDPVGYLQREKSTDYEKLLTDSSLTSINCVGPSTPTLFSSLAFSLGWRSFFFTAVVNTKLGHYVRKKALNYNDLVNHLSDGTTDYYLRWQKPGDESTSQVPALALDDSKRDQFFSRSAYNVVSADHIRLQTVQLGYNFNQLLKENKLVKNLEVIFTVSNCGLLWSKNKFDVDPDVEMGANPEPKAFTLSIKATF